MKAIRKFLRELLTPRMVWVDENQQGHWVQRKRMHPALRAFIGGGIALIAAIFTVNYFWGTAPQVPEGEPQPEAAASSLPPSPPAPSVLVVEEPTPPAPSEGLAFVPDEVRGAMKAETPVPPRSDAGGTALRLPEPEKGRQTLEINLRPGKEQSAPTEGKRPGLRPSAPTSGRRQDYWIHIDKGHYTLSLYRGQDVVKTYSVAVGKNPGDQQAIGDHRTPVGHFRVVSIENASRWKHDFGDGKGKIAGAYGPWFIRLDAGGWKGIGIHGTHDPDSRGTMATEGCIRLSNEEIQDLKRYAYRNMRVVIEE